MTEEWRMLPKNYGDYMVSSFGNVRRLKGSTSKGNILKFGRHTKGYLNVHINLNGKRRSVTVHKLVAIAFLGLKKGLQVNHKDGNKTNNHLSNIEVVTASKNQFHRCWILNKRNKSRFGEAGIKKMIAMVDQGHSYGYVAKKFGTIKEAVFYHYKKRKSIDEALAKFGGVE